VRDLASLVRQERRVPWAKKAKMRRVSPRGAETGETVRPGEAGASLRAGYDSYDKWGSKALNGSLGQQR